MVILRAGPTVAPPAARTEIVLQGPIPEFFGVDEADAMRERLCHGTVTVLSTDGCRGTVTELEDRGVTITTGPEDVPWGIYHTIEDLSGNPFNLVEQACPVSSRGDGPLP